MKIYIYAHSGHSHELNRVRRCSIIEKLLEELDPLLCTSDFRAGAYAKDMLDIPKYVNIDIIENLPNLMIRGDILIFDSDEPSETLVENMKNFSTLLYEVGKDIPYSIIDSSIFNKESSKQEDKKVLFYGDNDYVNNLLKEIDDGLEKSDLSLLLGHYFFLGNERKLEPYFESLIDEEEYIETIRNTKYLLSGNENAVLESLNCGNSPVLFLREDVEYKLLDTIKSLNIPVIENKNLNETIKEFNKIIQDYPNTGSIGIFDFSTIKSEIESKIELFKKINNR